MIDLSFKLIRSIENLHLKMFLIEFENRSDSHQEYHMHMILKSYSYCVDYRIVQELLCL